MKKLNYHSHNLELIKRQLGASCVMFIQIGKSFGLKVIKDGQAKEFSLSGTPEDVTPQRYKELLQTLKDSYGER